MNNKVLVLRKLHAWIGRPLIGKYASTAISDRDVIDSFIAEPRNTFLVSFPRTGSHWLRMLMELYFERPSLIRVFYFPEKANYLTFHTHDMELDLERNSVIYLYRNPVDTVYSQLYYNREPIDSRQRVVHWTAWYGEHLNKWLSAEQFTERKTILMFDRMRESLVREFGKVTQHFGLPLDARRFHKIASRVTKNEVKRKTWYLRRIVTLRRVYEVRRAEFRDRFGGIIWDSLLGSKPHLSEYFDKSEI